MTAVSQKELFAEFRANLPASPASIARGQAGLGFPLPPDYLQFLLRRNGGEGFVGKGYLVAWRVEELAQKNTAYLVDEAAPELLLFGSNGAGEAFAFDTRSTPVSIVAVPFILDLRDAITIAPNFNSFLQFLYRSESLFE